MNNKIYLFIIVSSALLLWTSCVDDNGTEEIFPEVEILSPLACDTIYFNQTVTYRIRISDKSGSGLGNIAMDIHNNFNHHTHGSHVTCSMDPKKNPQHPYEHAWIFSLPNDASEYILEEEIMIPGNKNDSTLHDYGDYHYHIYVTNNEGYQTFTTLDVKLLHK